ncbi:universal stress protein [Agromyces sp. NPDC055520]
MTWAGPLLVGIDGTVASRAAITWALARAKSLGVDVALLMVVDDEWGTIGSRALDELRESAEAIAEREFEFAREVAASTQVRVGLASGNPMLTLSDESSEFAMVVIGTHKTGYFHGRAFGSRSLQLAGLTPVPMAVIPVESARARTGVVVGVGEAPGWADVVRFAAAEAARLGETLVMLRRARDEGPDQRIVEAAGVAEQVEPQVRVEVRRVESLPGEALAAASRRSVVTISGRPTPIESRSLQPLGRANHDLLLNLSGPAILVPQYIDASIEREAWS